MLNQAADLARDWPRSKIDSTSVGALVVLFGWHFGWEGGNVAGRGRTEIAERALWSRTAIGIAIERNSEELTVAYQNGLGLHSKAIDGPLEAPACSRRLSNFNSYTGSPAH